MIFFQNTHPKILKLPPIDYKSCVLALETSELGLGKITILPLKYNKLFFKPTSLVTPSNALLSLELIQRATIMLIVTLDN